MSVSRSCAAPVCVALLSAIVLLFTTNNGSYLETESGDTDKIATRFVQLVDFVESATKEIGQLS